MSRVKVDFTKTLAPIKPLHGLNNGPVGYGGLVDVGHYYREMGVPLVRLHDPNWPNPREVDIPQIFPNFDADPEDPANYDFRRTDTYIRKILDTGARIVYRLGVSIENTVIRYYTNPPTDNDQWARICIGIIKHYTYGWADGMRDAVAYWEIWNEPDNGPCMWTGTFEQYLELYGTAAKAIKAFDPSLKVGGFAATYPKGEQSKVPQFLNYCLSNDVPLDFLSWHTYSDRPEKSVENARAIQTALDERGFTDTESHMNEWNYVASTGHTVFEPGYEYLRREVFENQKGAIGASFVAATMILLQDEKVDVANYYDGQPCAVYCGIFDMYGVPQKAFRAFTAFRHLLDYPDRAQAEVVSSDGNLYALAAVDTSAHKAAVLISRYEGETDYCDIELVGIQLKDDLHCEALILDNDRSLEPLADCRIGPDAHTLRILLPRHSIILIKLS